MLDALSWLVTQIGLGFYNLFFAVTHPSLWLDWSDKEALMRFVYYGASVEFFFVVFDIFLVVTLIGLIFRPFMWACVRGLEGFANAVGRTAATVEVDEEGERIKVLCRPRVEQVAPELRPKRERERLG